MPHARWIVVPAQREVLRVGSTTGRGERVGGQTVDLPSGRRHERDELVLNAVGPSQRSRQTLNATSNKRLPCTRRTCHVVQGGRSGRGRRVSPLV